MAKDRLVLSMSCCDYDRCHALVNGRIEVDGFELVVSPTEPEESFHRAFQYREFDVTELSPAALGVAIEPRAPLAPGAVVASLWKRDMGRGVKKIEIASAEVTETDGGIAMALLDAARELAEAAERIASLVNAHAIRRGVRVAVD